MVVQYKCPSCGADMQYDAESRKLKCTGCGRLMAVDAMKQGGEKEGEEIAPFSADEIEDETSFGRIGEEAGSGAFGDGEGCQYVCNNPLLCR